MKITCKTILLLWMQEALRRAHAAGSDLSFQSHHIETHCKHWGARVHGKTYAATNYMRRFREIREALPYPTYNIRDIRDISPAQDRESTWLIIPMDKPPSGSRSSGRASQTEVT